MTSDTSNILAVPDFRTKLTLWLSITTLVLITPLSINHFFQARYLLGAGSLAIVILFTANAWLCFRGRYVPMLMLVGFTPLVSLFLANTFGEMPLVASFWCYPAVLSFYFMLRERQAWLANAIFLAILLPRGWQMLEPPIALRFMVTLVCVSLFSAIFVRVITEQQRKLEAQVVTDPLTGLLNRTLLNDTLEHAVQQNKRMKTPMTLVALDLDHFKQINDTLGHATGDQVLSRIGDLLRGRIRLSDKIFRMGGEEFLVLLFNTESEAAESIAEELRSTIASLPIHPDHAVTVSMGIATLQTEEDWDTWMKRCDDNLYRAKRNGRNQVVV